MKMQELGSNSSSNLIIKLDKLSTRAEMTSKIKFQNYFSNSAINPNKRSNLKNSQSHKNSICKQLSQIQWEFQFKRLSTKEEMSEVVSKLKDTNVTQLPNKSK